VTNQLILLIAGYVWLVVAAAWTHHHIHRRRRTLRHWTDHTVLTVVEPSGRIYASTLTKVWQSGQWDYVWDQPIAVSMFNGNTATVLRYRSEPDVIPHWPKETGRG
jgi:hypothetical protein